MPPEVTFDGLRHALTPRDPPQFPVGASAEALAEQMRVEGCCVLPALIQGAALERIQAAWLRVHDPIRREYAEAAAKGHGVSPGDSRGRSFANSDELPPFHGETLTRNHFHIPPSEFCGLETGPLEPELLHLLAGRGCELVVDVIARYLGGPVRLTGIDPITATREEGQGGYVTWHRDEGDSLIVGAGIDPSAAAACTPQGIAEVQALADRTTSEQLRSGDGSGDGSGPSVQAGSPAPWDPDLVLLEPRPSLLSMGGKRVKAVFAPFGVGADGGVTTVVPRTHTLPHPAARFVGVQCAGEPHPVHVLGQPFSGWGSVLGGGGGATEHRRGPLLPQELMPNAFPFAVPPGSFALFDSTTWHCALPNTSGIDRSNTR